MKVLSLVIATLAVSIPSHAAEKYPATVNDGTAETIRPGRLAIHEPSEEFLDSQAPAPVAKKKIPAPKKLTAKLGDPERPVRPTYEDRVQEVEAAQIEKSAADAIEAPAVEAAAPSAPTATGELPDDLPALFPADGIELSSDEAVASPAATNVSAPVVPTVTAPVETRAAEKAAVKAEVAKKPVTGTFDAVPDKRIPELSKRLKYANEILKRWGRAYDYRTTTLKEFRKIVAELETAEEKTSVTN